MDDYDLKWPALLRGTLVRRYQRFKADIKLRNGHIVTAHCPNTGSMRTCSAPGRTAYISCHHRKERKLKYTWEMIEMPTSLVGVNTSVPNHLTKAAIITGKVPELRGYVSIRSEVGYGDGSRIDILLQKRDRICFVEVKNCTLVENSVAFFPDAATSRGLKHLDELEQQVAKGNRAVMFFLIQRMDAKQFKPADHIDRAYGRKLRKVYRKGVEILVYDVLLDQTGIRLNRRIPYSLSMGKVMLAPNHPMIVTRGKKDKTISR
jgi:sugar fermentation stimulation protein A